VQQVTSTPTTTQSVGQPQQPFKQFQLMTTTAQNLTGGQAGQTTQLIQQPILIQPSSQQTTQTIRKVSSSTNLNTLQQKVQLLGRQSIQIVQTNPQRIMKTNTSMPSSNITTTQPIQFQQVLNQQRTANKSPSSLTPNLQSKFKQSK